MTHWALIAPIVEEVVRRQNDAIDAVCWDALRLGMSVHVYPNPGTLTTWDHGASLIYNHHIGIALEDGPVRIVWHSMWDNA